MLVSMSRALLVIDVQESFRQRPLWAAISNPGIAGDVARLVDGARGAGDVVVWVLHAEPGSGTSFDPAGGHVPRTSWPGATRGRRSSATCSTS
jgi:nicotinamidase-related amidase